MFFFILFYFAEGSHGAFEEEFRGNMLESVLEYWESVDCNIKAQHVLLPELLFSGAFLNSSPVMFLWKVSAKKYQNQIKITR